MLGDLKRTQDVRLGQVPPAHLGSLPGPSDAEMELAGKVTEGLADLARQVNPGDVVSTNSLRKSMGIDANAPPPTDDPATADDVQPGDKGDDSLPPGSGSQSAAATEDDEDEDDDEDDDDDDEGDDDEESGDEAMEAGDTQDSSQFSKFHSSNLQEEASMDGTG